jgi:hypothetical protein
MQASGIFHIFSCTDSLWANITLAGAAHPRWHIHSLSGMSVAFPSDWFHFQSIRTRVSPFTPEFGEQLMLS